MRPGEPFRGLLTPPHHVQLWHLFLVGLLLGITIAFDNPARQVFVAETVPRRNLMNIITLNPFLLNGARTAGPAASWWQSLAKADASMPTSPLAYVIVVAPTGPEQRRGHLRHGRTRPREWELSVFVHRLEPSCISNINYSQHPVRVVLSLRICHGVQPPL